MAAWNLFSYICTRALHSFAHWHAASTAIPLLLKATFTPSIQPSLGLPGTRPPLTSAINTLLDIRYSSILSTCPNHLNTLWSALLANSLSFYSSSPTHLFFPNSIHSWHSNQTSQTLHLKNITFLLSALLISHVNAPYNAVDTITSSYRLFLPFIPQSSIAQHTFQHSPRSIPLFINICLSVFNHTFDRSGV